MRNIATLLLIISLTAAFGQGNLEFEKETHDFRDVSEEGGLIEYQFKFKNSGDQPVKIVNVKASCGCTTPNWTKELVMPGGEGFITAQYNPLNRPGQFRKSLQVTSNAKNGNQTLYIEGYVKPRSKTIEDELPNIMGALRIKYKSMNLGKITNEKAITREFDVYNDGESSLTLLAERTIGPEHISVSLSPSDLAPKENGKLVIVYDPEKKGSLGFHSDNVRFYTSEAPADMKEIYIVATIEEYFPPMSEQELALAPKLIIDKTTYDFGRVSAGSEVETTFVMTNHGKSMLTIRETRPNCGCTISKLEKRDLQPGESVPMTVSFNSEGRKGRQFKTVTIFSNDPVAPTQMISIRAEIAE